MYVRFFSNASSGSGTVNLTNYKAFFHRLTQTESGGIQFQAICFTNSVGTPVGCSNPTVVNSKTQIILNNAFPVGVNSGNANGSLRVYLNGQKIPRFINSTLTPDASYTEINATTIQLDRDYSSLNYSVEIYQDVAVVDSNTQNTTNIATINTHKFKNYLINSNFDFWQRGTSFSTPSSTTYNSDRWKASYDGTIGTFTISQQAFALGQTAVPNEPLYFLRWNHTAAGSGSTVRQIAQRIESVRTLAGKTATLTFWMKADSARSVTVTMDQSFGSGGSPSASTNNQPQVINLTTSWQQYSLVYNLPSIAGATLGTNGDDFIQVRWSLPINTTMTIDIAQVQLNEGGIAAPWVYASGGSSLNKQAELAMCQRYYELFSGGYGGSAVSGSNNAALINYAVTKRGAPTVTWLSNIGAVNFPTTTTTQFLTATVSYCGVFKTANGTGQDSRYHDNYSAEAEL
jgi:hypothetical protein